ncbi:MAG TPA: hypothetical protein VK631_25520, partial [Solirubrobacteraceae bacterium]|nr:hypothetical protein [Solirubrobacteraceae bacterium]
NPSAVAQLPPLPPVPTVTPPPLPQPLPLPDPPSLPVLPPLPVPVPDVPEVPAPAPDLPSAPAVPRIVPTPSVGGGGSGSPSSGGATDPADGGSADTGGGSAGAGRDTAAAGGSGSTGSPAARRPRARSNGRPPDPAERRVRRDRRLRRTVERLSGCLDTLGTMQRRVLVLRAGVGPGDPQTRRAVAQRLDTTVRRVGRVERRGLRALHGAAGAGRCGTSAPLAAGGTGAPPTLAADTSPSSDGTARSESSGVKDEFRTQKPPDELETAVAPGGDGGSPVLLMIAAAFLAGFLAVWSFDRYRHHGGHAA